MRIPIVNEQDEVMGYKDWKDKDPKDITRVSGLWVTDHKDNILLAQRAFTKKYDPGLWGPAVAGTVEEGETYESNVKKEAQEEIGLVDFKLKEGPKIRLSIHHEYFVQYFFTTIPSNYAFNVPNEEVVRLQWISKDRLRQQFKEKPEMFLEGYEEELKILNIL